MNTEITVTGPQSVTLALTLGITGTVHSPGELGAKKQKKENITKQNSILWCRGAGEVSKSMAPPVRV
jgi:hypothetical protein